MLDNVIICLVVLCLGLAIGTSWLMRAYDRALAKAHKEMVE